MYDWPEFVVTMYSNSYSTVCASRSITPESSHVNEDDGTTSVLGLSSEVSEMDEIEGSELVTPERWTWSSLVHPGMTNSSPGNTPSDILQPLFE